jgi:hypothetical protein
MMFMANIRRVLLAGCALGAAFMATATPALAQATGLPKTQAEFEKQIGITADQKKKMDDLKKKYDPQMLAIQKKYQPQVQKLQQQFAEIQTQMQALQQKAQVEMRPLAEKAQKEMQAILTPVQQKKIKEIEAQVQQQRQQAGGGAGGGLMGAPRP